MTRWKLSRLSFGNDEFSLLEGEEVTLGRGNNNNIVLSSIVISRNHCVLNAEKQKVLITDLKSSNGIYVGLKKITPNTPFSIEDSDVIGIGWTQGAPVANIKDTEKYMFKLIKEKPSRISFQSDNEAEEEAINEAKSLSISSTNKSTQNKLDLSRPSTSRQSLKHTEKVPVKRKIEDALNKTKGNNSDRSKYKTNGDVILLSDSDSEVPKEEPVCKKPKLEPVNEEMPLDIDIKTEREDVEYNAFKIKQEYIDEPIQIDSESDDESVQWRIRLSQSSPGKPLVKVIRESKPENEELSYSQIDDFDEEEYMEDLILIPPQPPKDTKQKSPEICEKSSEPKMDGDDEEFMDDLISLHKPDDVPLLLPEPINEEINKDVTDTSSSSLTNQSTLLKSPEPAIKQFETAIVPVRNTSPTKHVVESSSNFSKEKEKSTTLVQGQSKQSKSTILLTESKRRSSSTSSKHRKDKKDKPSSSKRNITDSQKEERKKKLKDIATKEKEETEQKSSKHSSSSSREKGVVNVKVTSTNRGAFLTDGVVQGVVKPIKRKETSPKPRKSKEKKDSKSSKISSAKSEDVENKNKKSGKHHSSKSKEKVETRKEQKTSKSKEKDEPSKPKSNNKTATETRIPLKSLKPLSESEESFSGKPYSKVEPMPPIKAKKSVRFSDQPPEIHIFEIEEGNKMKKTALVKTSLVDGVFSLENITLMKILAWNPQWLEEQLGMTEPPPILGSNNPPPMAIFHSFADHNQYVQMVGDLLLMEIWECLSQGYMNARKQPAVIQMRITCQPPIPSKDRSFELFNLSVHVSVPNSEARQPGKVPRTGEVLLVSFGPENAKKKRFFYVHNVRAVPLLPNSRHSQFYISLHTCYTDKMKSLKAGEVMTGQILSTIQKELMLFKAMQCLATSPLCDAVLKPQPSHFIRSDDPRSSCPMSQWTRPLNPSQQTAVHSLVQAALSDRPGIQMVQGPPGTGKSGVICAMVMSYFYDAQERRHPNRGKVLICATSNAAVDELVCRLLKVRRELPKVERFRMVRVGRAEAMHPRALEISSQQLAQRDLTARQSAEPVQPGLHEEIVHLEAKINMYRSQEQTAKDPAEAANWRSRSKALLDKIGLLRRGGGGGGATAASADELLNIEKRIIEGADIIVTTLASAYSHKMRGIRRRIAMCIIDEAGQAIEPETLIPLTLEVTRLALIGDPQQLPGFICSQRAKKYGLGESLFARLSSCAENWGGESPVILLNQQYRMHAEIADYPNRAFYAGRILSVPSRRPLLDIPPYSIVSISSGDKGQGSSGANEMEAWGVARLVVALHSVLAPLRLSLAVITPYNAHKDLIKRNLRFLQDPSEGHIEVNTVDSFQGQERDVVVASLARSQGVGFLTDAGRMNVMLTRARHALLVCLNPHAMLKNYQWRTLIEDAQQRKLYRVLPQKMCQGLSAGQIAHGDLLKCITTPNPPHK